MQHISDCNQHIDFSQATATETSMRSNPIMAFRFINWSARLLQRMDASDSASLKTLESHAMSTRPARKTTPVEASNDLQVLMSLFADSYRRQLELFSETTSTLLRSAAAIQDIQQRAMHQTTERLENATQNAGSNDSASDILAAQAKFWAIDQKLVNDYRRDTTSALLKAQSGLSNCATSPLKDSPSASDPAPIGKR